MNAQAKDLIPQGYRQNAQGHLVPESAIAPIDLERDELVSASWVAIACVGRD